MLFNNLNFLYETFHGSVTLDPTQLGQDAGKAAGEIVKHLSGLVGSEVDISLEINARVPDGVPENVERIVTENCRSLRFKTQGFEES